MRVSLQTIITNYVTGERDAGTLELIQVKVQAGVTGTLQESMEILIMITVIAPIHKVVCNHSDTRFISKGFINHSLKHVWSTD